MCNITSSRGLGSSISAGSSPRATTFVEQEVEGAAAPDHAREDFSRDPLRRCEQHRLDARLPFAPPELPRQAEMLAVEIGLGALPARHGDQSPLRRNVGRPASSRAAPSATRRSNRHRRARSLNPGKGTAAESASSSSKTRAPSSSPWRAALARRRRAEPPGASGRAPGALSHESEFATRSPEVTARAHAAVAARHVRNALSLRTRSVLRDVRWRWTLNVLWTAA